MNKTQAKRLLNVARALRESPAPKKFTMSHYIHGDYYDEARPRYNPKWCGTPACALGHYGARKDLQRLMRVIPIKSANDQEYPTLIYNNIGDEVVYKDSLIMKHFGLDNNEVEELFSSVGCGMAETPKEAARYIVKFVTQKMGNKKKRA